jgi:hypothetical protein
MARLSQGKILPFSGVDLSIMVRSQSGGWNGPSLRWRGDKKMVMMYQKKSSLFEGRVDDSVATGLLTF